MESVCCGDSASASPDNLVSAATEMTANATARLTVAAHAKEPFTMTMLCAVFIVLFYGTIFLLCLVMYPKNPKESAGDEESGEPLPEAEKFAKVAVRTKTEVCVICLEDLKKNDVVRMLVKCEHVFHVRCIDSWCLYRLACPVCRAPFRLCEAC